MLLSGGHSIVLSVSWFGSSCDIPHCDGLKTVKTPVGATCEYCNDEIEIADCGILVPDLIGTGWIAQHAVHLECVTRLLIGSVKHQRHVCSCFGKHAWDFDRYRYGFHSDAISATNYLEKHGRHNDFLINIRHGRHCENMR
jgi:hypothetical protein